MRKFFILFATLALVACNQPKTDVFALVADGYPIIPARLADKTERIYLTDYVPALVGQKGVADSLDITDDGMIQLLQISSKNGESVDIAVLPNLPYCNALTCIGGEDSTLTFQINDDPGEVQFMAFIQNHVLCDCKWTHDGGIHTLRLPEDAISGRSYLRVYACDEGKTNYNDILIPLQDGKPVRDAKLLNRHDDNAQVLYSLMIDRFNNGNTANDWKMNSPEVLDIVDYQGGDFAGITEKINSGWFDQLGITTLWISPVTQNPWTAWGMYPFKNGNKFDSDKTYTKFSGYHGYWPISIKQLEKRFGTEDEFRAMLDAAHAHGMNVILDYVANHMHIEAPTFQEHPDWHTDSILPDGRRNFELWDEARLTTWFDKHIPTLDLEREEVCQPLTDSALFWLENYELDGFRHDACKHIPLNYWRMLGQKMATRFPGRHIWMIGETYGDTHLIGSYVKTGMLPAQFDFNIYHKAIDLIGHEGTDMRELDAVIRESLAAYGAHHTMGNISGNHDKPRFISLVGGALDWDEDSKEAGWTRQVGVTRDGNKSREERAYRAAMLLEVINLTIPGVPCIYQGDEFGAAGANDPDNRGLMQFADYSTRQQQFREEMENLITLHRNSMPLMYGDYIPVNCDSDVLVFDRIYLGERVRVTIDKKNMKYSID